ncbi:unnamed protein product [Ectocarpus sp. 6 AP-2014]
METVDAHRPSPLRAKFPRRGKGGPFPRFDTKKESRDESGVEISRTVKQKRRTKRWMAAAGLEDLKKRLEDRGHPEPDKALDFDAKTDGQIVDRLVENAANVYTGLDDGQKTVFREESFDTLTASPNPLTMRPTFESVACFLADYRTENPEDLDRFDIRDIYAKMLAQIRATDDYSLLNKFFSDPGDQQVFDEWVEAHGSYARSYTRVDRVRYRGTALAEDSVWDFNDAGDEAPDKDEDDCGGGDGDAGGISDSGDGRDSGEDLGRILRPTRTRVWTEVCATFFGFRSCFKNGIDCVSEESFQKMEANLAQAARFAGVTDCPLSNSRKVSPEKLEIVNQCVAKMNSAVCGFTGTGTSDAPDLNHTNDAVLLASFGLAVVVALLVVVATSDGQIFTPPVVPCQGKDEAITEEEEDEILAELAKDKARSTLSYKTFCKEQADYVKNDLGIETPQSMQFADENYTLVDGAVPVYILDLIEKYMKRRGFKREAMFTKVVNNVAYHDYSRQLFNCALDWVMYFLIAVPVSLALAKHGLLNMVGGGLRAAKVVTYILSPAKAGDATKRLHAVFVLADHFVNLEHYFVLHGKPLQKVSHMHLALGVQRILDKRAFHVIFPVLFLLCATNGDEENIALYLHAALEVRRGVVYVCLLCVEICVVVHVSAQTRGCLVEARQLV